MTVQANSASLVQIAPADLIVVYTVRHVILCMSHEKYIFVTETLPSKCQCQLLWEVGELSIDAWTKYCQT